MREMIALALRRTIGGTLRPPAGSMIACIAAHTGARHRDRSTARSLMAVIDCTVRLSLRAVLGRRPFQGDRGFDPLLPQPIRQPRRFHTDERPRRRLLLRLPLGSQPLGLSNKGWGHLGSEQVASLCCLGVSLSGSQRQPLLRFHIVLRHACASGVHKGEIKLTARIALFRGETEPA